jgi:hypothetical protein
MFKGRCRGLRLRQPIGAEKRNPKSGYATLRWRVVLRTPAAATSACPAHQIHRYSLREMMIWPDAGAGQFGGNRDAASP